MTASRCLIQRQTRSILLQQHHSTAILIFIELAEECRKQGVKLGFYPRKTKIGQRLGGARSKDWATMICQITHHWDPKQDGDFAKLYLHTKAIPQLKELLTNYGDFPAVIWFDTPTDDMTPEACR